MATNTKAILQSVIIAALFAIGLFTAIFSLSFSWVKIIAIAAILAGGLVWLASHGRLRQTSKYFVIATLIFSISFTGFEGYLLWNAGYPTTNVALGSSETISYPSMLNVSLTDLIQGIQKSPTYTLLSAEHGKTTAETIKLDTEFSGGFIEVDFYGEGSMTWLGFMASSGDQYHVQVSTYSGQPFSLSYVQSSSGQAFKQIDTLGLNWFYNTAIGLAQNRTGSAPKIDALSLTMNFEDHGITYQGITVLLVGSFQGASTLIADFEPNGTLIYMSQPQ